MSNTSLWDMSTSAASNTSIQGNNIGEGCPASGINDAIRALVAQALGALKTVAAGGTADAITATLAPAPDALTDGMMARVRAAHANATTTPTLNPNGLGAHTITKLGGAAVAPGDIAGADHELIFVYKLASTRWELLNPAGLTSGTSGGVPYFSASSTLASSGALTANAPVVGGGAGAAPTTGLSKFTNSLTSDTSLTLNTYSDGPSIAQGTTGTWFASGKVTVVDTGAGVNVIAKLWDATTVIDSGIVTTGAPNNAGVIALSGYITSPAGNIRITVKTNGSASKIKFNQTGESKDSTVSAIQIG